MRAYLGYAVMLMMMSHCTSIRPSSEVRCGVLPDKALDIIRGSSEASFRQITSAIVDDGCEPQASWLRDMTPLKIADVTVDRPEHLYHFGVNTVSDYLLCLLQFRDHVSSRTIVGLRRPNLLAHCRAQYECEVCNSTVYPLNSDIRDQLVEYWEERLNRGRDDS